MRAAVRIEADYVCRFDGVWGQSHSQRFGGIDQSLQLQSNFIRSDAFAELIAGPVRDDG